MNNPGQNTLFDIESQTEILQYILENFSSRIPPGSLEQIQASKDAGWVFTGCGTTYALGLSLASLFRHSGDSAIALPASEIKFYPECLPRNAACLAPISRSGETSETLWAVQAFRQQRPQGKILAITTNPLSSLAEMVDYVLDVHEGRDTSVIETRSFTSMLLAGQLLARLQDYDQPNFHNLARLTEFFEQQIVLGKVLAEEIIYRVTPSRFFFLGGGPLYGAACQAVFTLKECSAAWAEPYHPLEFRHGPRTAATPGALVTLLASPEHITDELRLLREMHDQGAHTLLLIESRQGLDLSGVDEALEFHSGLDFWDQLTLYLPLLQWLAYFHTLQLGKDPDKPEHLSAVTKL